MVLGDAMGNSVTLVVELKGAQLKVDLYQQFHGVTIQYSKGQ